MSGPASSSEHVSTGAGPTVTNRPLEYVREHAWSVAIWIVMLGWSIVLFAIVRDHYVNFRLARFDLGNMVQAVWSTAQGRPLDQTVGATGEQMSRLGGHVDPILAALAPLWVVAPTPLTLVAVQIAAVALGALPVFWLARRHGGSDRAAGLLALAYLAYPWVAWTAVDAFHPVTLAVPLLLFCVWFLDTDRLVPFAVCAVLVATTGELMGVVLAALGLWYALARGRRLAGGLVAVGGAGWSLVAIYLVVPAFADGPSVFYGAFEEVGGSPWGLVRTLVTEPATVLSAVTEGRDLFYLFLLALPLGGAFVLNAGLAAVAIPQLGVNLLADVSSTTDPHAHYVAGILPFLFGAIALGLARFTRSTSTRVSMLVLTLALSASVVAGPWPGALGGTPSWYQVDAPAERARALRRAVALVPHDAPVSSTNKVGSHLAARRYAYVVPVVRRAEWIVVESADPWIPRRIGGALDPEALSAFVERIEGSPEWRKVFDQDGVHVYRRSQT